MHYQQTNNRDRVVPVTSADAFVASMKSELVGAELECQCRETVGEIIDKLVDRTHRDYQDGALRYAREMRDEIQANLDFLIELDDLAADEKDLSCFSEIATMFDAIGVAAAAGARAARLMAGETTE